jgi:hypothetical protein
MTDANRDHHRGAYVGEFSGWTYPRGRVRGHVPLRCHDDRRELADACLDVFDQYRALGLLPLGQRGVGYRLEFQTIGGRLVVKGDDMTAEELWAAYGLPTWTFDNVGDLITRLCRGGPDARRRGARALAWEDVDDGRTTSLSPFVSDDLIGTVRHLADGCGPDLLADQPIFVETWVEAKGGLGLWSTICHRWGVEVYSGSGQIPVKAARLAASRWTAAADRHPDVLLVLVTDLDPRGLIIADRLVEETRAFVADYGDAVKVTPVRLALTEAQGEEHGLSWGPAKTEEGHTVARTAEAEALPPEVARDAFDGLMEDALDLGAVQRTRDAWAAQVDEVHRLLDAEEE